MPEAYNRLGNDINRYGQTEAIERVIKGLRRLTSEYKGKELEEIIVRIIKGDIFAYVYSSDYYPPYSKTSEISWGLGLIIMNVAPTLDNTPHHKNGVYVLVQDNAKKPTELYFISSWNRSSITKIKIEQNNLDELASKLFSAEKDKDYSGITELTDEQILQIKKMTGHILRVTDARGTWKEHAGWQALLPSQVNLIISNKKQKIILKPGQQGFDINDLWVVKQEATEGSNNDSTQIHTSVNSKEKDVTEDITDVELINDQLRRKTNRRRIFDNFIGHLIDMGYTKKQFRDEITTTFLAGKEKLEDCDKFNHHSEVTNVYTVRRTKDGKYLLHFSFTNQANESFPQKPYSIDTVDNIFDEVARAIKEKKNKG